MGKLWLYLSQSEASFRKIKFPNFDLRLADTTSPFDYNPKSQMLLYKIERIVEPSMKTAAFNGRANLDRASNSSRVYWKSGQQYYRIK